MLTPIPDEAPVDGWSASGSGGIVYVAAGEGQVGSGADLPAGCAPWTISNEHTTAAVVVTDAPTIADARTVGVAADLTTKVEGGNETHLRAETFVAYLGDFVAYVVVVIDPGASGPGLESGFPAKLLVDTVSALRG
jgi:hypothetical protein